MNWRPSWPSDTFERDFFSSKRPLNSATARSALSAVLRSTGEACSMACRTSSSMMRLSSMTVLANRNCFGGIGKLFAFDGAGRLKRFWLFPRPNRAAIGLFQSVFEIALFVCRIWLCTKAAGRCRCSRVRPARAFGGKKGQGRVRMCAPSTSASVMMMMRW